VLKHTNISMYLGYAVSALTFVFGIILICGFAFLYIPSQLRIMFGVVMILWGVYRFVLTRTRMRQQHEDDEE
jgi:uncharacterized membrane protein